MASSEMNELRELSDTKNKAKDWLDHTNDARSEIAELRAKNTELKNQIAQAQNSVSDGPAKEALTARQELKFTWHNQEYQNKVERIDSSVQMCLNNGVDGILDEKSFRDFLQMNNEPLDKPRPSYTWEKSKESFANKAVEAPKVAANVWNQKLNKDNNFKSQWTQISQKPSFTSDFADLKDFTGTLPIPTDSDEVVKDTKWESPIITTNVLKDKAAKWSWWIPTESFSDGFPKWVASWNTDPNKYVLKEPKLSIGWKNPNQIASSK